MKLKMMIRWLLIICLFNVVTACSQQPVHLQTIYSSNNCMLREQIIKSFDTVNELNNFFDSMPKQFFQAPVKLPEVDYGEQTLLLYALGQKPTAGYSIELYREDAVIKNQTLYLPVRVLQPASGSLQAQVITSPCQVYTLVRTDYSEVVVEGYLSE